MNKTIHDNKLPDKTYTSKAFPQYKTVPDYKGGSKEQFQDNVRIVTKVVDSNEQYSFATIKVFAPISFNPLKQLRLFFTVKN